VLFCFFTDIDKEIQLENAKREAAHATEQAERATIERIQLQSSGHSSGGNTPSNSSKPPSGGGTPGSVRGSKVVATLRQSISTGHLSGGSTSPSSPQEPAAVRYRKKLSDLAGRLKLRCSSQGSNFTFNRVGVSVSAQPSFSIACPDVDEKQVDSFYKKLYYFFVLECGADADKMSVEAFSVYEVTDTTSPSMSRVDRVVAIVIAETPAITTTETPAVATIEAPAVTTAIQM
jgi:hypothetical protein